MRISIFAIFCLGATLAAACRSQSSPFGGAANSNDNTPVIVEINGYPEHLSAYERFVKARLSDFTAQEPLNQKDHDQLRSRMFDEFVQRQIVVREALKKNIFPTDDEIRKAIEDQHKQTSGGESNDQSQLAMEGSERRTEMLHDLLTLKFYNTEVLKNVQVTQPEIEEYFKKNQAQYNQANGFYVREIRVPEEAAAQKLHQQAIAKPNEFDVLAKQNSKAPTAINGGLMLYSAQQLPPVLEQAITPLKAGEISKVVQSNYGFHIFKLEKRAEARSFEQVKEEIQDKLLREKNQALINQYNQRVRSEAQLKLHTDKLGFNYNGALKS